MNKTKILLFMLLITELKVYSQEYIDIVETKDNNIYTGVIIDNSNESIIIKAKDSTQLNIYKNNIRILTREHLSNKSVINNTRIKIYNFDNNYFNKIFNEKFIDNYNNEDYTGLPIIMDNPNLFLPKFIYNGIIYKTNFGYINLVNDMLKKPNIGEIIKNEANKYINKIKVYRILGPSLIISGIIFSLTYYFIAHEEYIRTYNGQNILTDTFNYFERVIIPASLGGSAISLPGIIFSLATNSTQPQLSRLIDNFNDEYYYKIRNWQNN